MERRPIISWLTPPKPPVFCILPARQLQDNAKVLGAKRPCVGWDWLFAWLNHLQLSLTIFQNTWSFLSSLQYLSKYLSYNFCHSLVSILVRKNEKKTSLLKLEHEKLSQLSSLGFSLRPAKWNRQCKPTNRQGGWCKHVFGKKTS